MMRLLEDRAIKVELRREKPERALGGRLLGTLNEWIDRIGPTVREMAEEAPEHLVYQSACHDLALEYVAGAPGTSIATNVCCAGVGLSVSGTTVYYIPRYVGATLPSGGVPVIRVADGVSAEQGRVTTWGRMGGPFGWSADRDLIAGALASFTHNWVGLLALFRDRPKLPLTQPWALPNMTLAETRAPNQLALPATFTYNVWRPAVQVAFVTDLKSDTPIEIGLDWWDAAKGDMARIESVKLDAGDNRLVAILRGPPVRIKSGFFTVNPIDASQGLVVSSVSTTPSCI